MKEKYKISDELLDSEGNLKSFKEQLEDSNFSKTIPYIVLEHSNTIVENNYPILINYSVIKKAEIKHNIFKSELYDLPKKLEEFILITKSQNREDSIIIFIDQFDNENRPIMISMELDKLSGTYRINNITSIYGRNNGVEFIEKLILEERILKKGKKIKQWLKSIGVQFSKDISNALFENSITSQK